MRAGYFGPEGTYTQEALLADTAGLELDTVPLPTIYDTVMAVHQGDVDRALVPIENSLEGSVNATLDALAMETDDVTIVGEVVHPIRHCLIARVPLDLSDIETVVSDGGGLRWALLGPFGVLDTNADGGLRENFSHFKEMISTLMNDLGPAPSLTHDVIERLSISMEKTAAESNRAEIRRWRDRMVRKIRGLKEADPKP